MQDVITDACFLHMCKHGFAQSLEVILDAATNDAHLHWAKLEPMKECFITKRGSDAKVAILRVLLKFNIGTAQKDLISALRTACKKGQIKCIPILMNALKCKLSDLPACRGLVYHAYDKYMMRRKMDAETIRLLLHHGLNANRVCNYEDDEKNILFTASRRCDAATIDAMLSSTTHPVKTSVLDKALHAFLTTYDDGEDRFDAIGTVSLLTAAGGNIRKTLFDPSLCEIRYNEVCRATIIALKSSDDFVAKTKVYQVAKHLSRHYSDGSLLALVEQMWP